MGFFLSSSHCTSQGSQGAVHCRHVWSLSETPCTTPPSPCVLPQEGEARQACQVLLSSKPQCPHRKCPGQSVQQTSALRPIWDFSGITNPPHKPLSEACKANAILCWIVMFISSSKRNIISKMTVTWLHPLVNTAYSVWKWQHLENTKSSLISQLPKALLKSSLCAMQSWAPQLIQNANFTSRYQFHFRIPKLWV